MGISRVFHLLFACCLSLTVSAQLYFPPNTGEAWETMDPGSLGWCQNKIDSLYSYLDRTNSKGFLLLKDGKIVLEKYFGTFTKDSLHVWNSAGKTYMAALIGIAQQENLLNINNTTTSYLGTGWSAMPVNQENAIQLKHHLTMTTGLDDTGDVDCTDPNCLTFMSNPGTRWSYHNAPYTLLGSVIENASGQALNLFANSRINNKIGITGFFYPFGYLRVFISSARSMARFGLMMLANGNWNGVSVLSDQNYLSAMTNTSQNYNLSYGYLTWLNGKDSFIIPRTQFVFPSSLVPNAPPDMFAALGKNSQILNIVPSQNLVLVRMGNGDGVSPIANIYTDSIWVRINNLKCTNGLVKSLKNHLNIYPNPSTGVVNIKNVNAGAQLRLYNLQGSEVAIMLENDQFKIECKGVYFLHITHQDMNEVYKITIVK